MPSADKLDGSLASDRWKKEAQSGRSRLRSEQMNNGNDYYGIISIRIYSFLNTYCRGSDGAMMGDWRSSLFVVFFKRVEESALAGTVSPSGRIIEEFSRMDTIVYAALSHS